MPRVRRTSTRQTRHGRKHKVSHTRVHVCVRDAARWKRNAAHRVAAAHTRGVRGGRARQDGVSLKVRAGIGPRRDASIPLSISHPPSSVISSTGGSPLPSSASAPSTTFHRLSDSPLSPSYSGLLFHPISRPRSRTDHLYTTLATLSSVLRIHPMPLTPRYVQRRLTMIQIPEIHFHHLVSEWTNERTNERTRGRGRAFTRGHVTRVLHTPPSHSTLLSILIPYSHSIPRPPTACVLRVHSSPPRLSPSFDCLSLLSLSLSLWSVCAHGVYVPDAAATRPARHHFNEDVITAVSALGISNATALCHDTSTRIIGCLINRRPCAYTRCYLARQVPAASSP